MKSHWQTRVYGPYDKEWLSLIERTDADVFYLPEYYKLIEKNFGYKVELFFHGDKNSFIIFPYYKKCINDLGFYNGPALYDISNAEYGGPLIHCADDVREQLQNSFLESFEKHCNETGVVTHFIRMNPLLGNHNLLPHTKAVNSVFYIDLRASINDIRAQFSKPCRNAIAKARREGLVCSHKSTAIMEFYSLYLQRMRELNSRKFYYYSEQYMLLCQKLLNNRAVLEVFMAKKDGVLHASSLFLGYKDTCYYYLSCYDKKYAKFAGTNLIIDEAIVWAKERGFKHLLLGGSERETLSSFKASFTKQHAMFYRSETIHNKSGYDTLVMLRKDHDMRQKNELQHTYFPQYRSGLE